MTLRKRTLRPLLGFWVNDGTDSVYVTLLTHEAEAFLDAAPLAGVPLSTAFERGSADGVAIRNDGRLEFGVSLSSV